MRTRGEVGLHHGSRERKRGVGGREGGSGIDGLSAKSQIEESSKVETPIDGLVG
jgi:hypothetical protein